jgi:hypothetical protein
MPRALELCERCGRRRCELSAISHEPSGAVQRWSVQLLVPEMWACLAIIVMWLAVLFDAIFGPDIVSIGVAGDRDTVPSAVALALFAFLSTWVVAWFGFRRERNV